MKIFKSILENSLLSELEIRFKNLEWKYGWRSNNHFGYGHWNYDFAPNTLALYPARA